MTTVHAAAPSLHAQIMNLPCYVAFPHRAEPDEARAFKVGHRYARRAAAELALAADRTICEQQRALDYQDVEIKGLREDAARYRRLRQEIDYGPAALCEWFTHTTREPHWSPINSYCDVYVDRLIAAGAPK